MKIELISIHVTTGTGKTTKRVPWVILKTLRRSLLPSLGFHHFSFFLLLQTIFLPHIFRESQKSLNTIREILPLINNKFPFSAEEPEMLDKLSCFLSIHSTWFVLCCRVEFRQFIVFSPPKYAPRTFRFCTSCHRSPRHQTTQFQFVCFCYKLCIYFHCCFSTVPCWFHFKPEKRNVSEQSACLFKQREMGEKNRYPETNFQAKRF